MFTRSKKEQRIANYPTGNTNPLPTISDNSNKKLQHNLIFFREIKYFISLFKVLQLYAMAKGEVRLGKRAL